MKLESATATASPAEARRGTKITRTPKVSPFLLLNDDTLDRLVAVASEEPAVADMVAGYRASVETAAMYGEILADECSHYEVPIP